MIKKEHGIHVCVAISRLCIKCKSGLENLGYYDVTLHCLTECEMLCILNGFFYLYFQSYKACILCMLLFIYKNRKQVIANTNISHSEVLSIWIKVTGGIYRTRCCFVKEVCDLRTLLCLFAKIAFFSLTKMKWKIRRK